MVQFQRGIALDFRNYVPREIQVIISRFFLSSMNFENLPSPLRPKCAKMLMRRVLSDGYRITREKFI